jgi:hypothetical protein
LKSLREKRRDSIGILALPSFAWKPAGRKTPLRGATGADIESDAGSLEGDDSRGGRKALTTGPQSGVACRTANVKYWRDQGMVTENRFRKISGHGDLWGAGHDSPTQNPG